MLCAGEWEGTKLAARSLGKKFEAAGAAFSAFQAGRAAESEMKKLQVVEAQEKLAGEQEDTAGITAHASTCSKQRRAGSPAHASVHSKQRRAGSTAHASKPSCRAAATPV